MGKRLEGHVRTNIDGQSAALPLACLHDSDLKGMAIWRFFLLSHCVTHIVLEPWYTMIRRRLSSIPGERRELEESFSATLLKS